LLAGGRGPGEQGQPAGPRPLDRVPRRLLPLGPRRRRGAPVHGVRVAGAPAPAAASTTRPAVTRAVPPWATRTERCARIGITVRRASLRAARRVPVRLSVVSLVPEDPVSVGVGAVAASSVPRRDVGGGDVVLGPVGPPGHGQLLAVAALDLAALAAGAGTAAGAAGAAAGASAGAAGAAAAAASAPASAAGSSGRTPTPSFSLIFFSISLARSGLSLRKLRAFSLPWPSWSPSYVYQAPALRTKPCSTPMSI